MTVSWFSNLIYPFTTVFLTYFLWVLADSYRPYMTFNWNGIRENVKDSVLVMRDYDAIPTDAVGYGGDTPRQYNTRSWIMRNCSNGELELLKNYPYGVI